MAHVLEYPSLTALSEDHVLEKSNFNDGKSTYTRSIRTYGTDGEGSEPQQVQVDKHVLLNKWETCITDIEIRVFPPLELSSLSSKTTGQAQVGSSQTSFLPHLHIKESHRYFVLTIPVTGAPDDTDGLSYPVNDKQHIKLNCPWRHPVNTSKIALWAADGSPTNLQTKPLTPRDRMPVKAQMWPAQADTVATPSTAKVIASKANSLLSRGWSQWAVDVKVAKILKEVQTNLLTKHHMHGSFVFKHLDINLRDKGCQLEPYAPPEDQSFEFLATRKNSVPTFTWILEYNVNETNETKSTAHLSLGSGLTSALRFLTARDHVKQADQTSRSGDAEAGQAETGVTDTE